MMLKRVEAILGVRAVTCWLLATLTFILYIKDKTTAAAGFMTLLTMAVTWMFKARSDREVRNGNK
jgi:hypothetical protein